MRADAVVQPLAAALAEPTRRVGKRFISLYTLAFLGLWAAFFAPIQVLLAQQMELRRGLALFQTLGAEITKGLPVGTEAFRSRRGCRTRLHGRCCRRHIARLSA